MPVIMLCGYTLYDDNINNAIRQELRITSTLDKIDICRNKYL
jgi:hypothetical protein